MAVRFSIDIQGKAEFDRAFNRVSSEIKDFTAVWEKVSDWLKRRTKRQFDNQGGDNRWQALSIGYAKWKQIEYPNKPILQRTGRMIDSLTEATADSVNRASKTSLEFGTSVPYAKYHQAGAGDLPQRKIFDLNEKDRKSLTGVIQRELVKIVRAQGFETFEFD